MDLHLLTSAKGGVGKTLLALSISRYYLRKNANVLGLDFNWVNPDFAHIMSFETMWTDRQNFQMWKTCGDCATILRPRLPYVLPQGTLDFWKRIGNALDLCEKEKRSLDYVVIDTSVHVANLIRRTEDRPSSATMRTRGEIANIVERHKIRKVCVWFVWTLAAMQSVDDLSFINVAMDDLEGSGCGFTSDRGLMHVLNPHALYSLDFLADIINTLKSRGQKKYNVDGLLKLAKADPAPHINFYDFATKLIKPTMEQYKNSQISIGNLWDAFAELVLSENSGSRGRPRNILALPTYTYKLVGYTDKFSGKGPLSLDDLEEKLVDIYPHVDKFLEHI